MWVLEVIAIVFVVLWMVAMIVGVLTPWAHAILVAGIMLLLVALTPTPRR